MAGGVSFDGSELGRLAADLDTAGRISRENTMKALEVTAINVREAAKSNARGISFAPLYPQSITHDVKSSGSTAEAEIGPDKDRPQGALGNLLEFGSVNNAPRKHMQPALDRYEDDYIRGLEKAIEDSMPGFS